MVLYLIATGQKLDCVTCNGEMRLLWQASGEKKSGRVKTQTADPRPQTADRRPQTADRRPQTADRRPQTADRRLQTADCRLQTADCNPFEKQLYARKVPSFPTFVVCHHKRQHFDLLVPAIKCRYSTADLCPQIYANMLISSRCFRLIGQFAQ